MNKNLLDLKIGETGTVKNIVKEELTGRILSLGLLPDTKIVLVRKALFGGTLYIRVNDTFLGLRPEEAQQIKIV
jgi:Fe2+ transport system protein FeoA